MLWIPQDVQMIVYYFATFLYKMSLHLGCEIVLAMTVLVHPCNDTEIYTFHQKLKIWKNLYDS